MRFSPGRLLLDLNAVNDGWKNPRYRHGEDNFCEAFLVQWFSGGEVTSHKLEMLGIINHSAAVTARYYYSYVDSQLELQWILHLEVK